MCRKLIAKILTCLLLLIAVGCSGSGEVTHIVIVSTNDMHAAFEQMPKLMSVVKDLRSRYDNVLVLDAGDHSTGSPYVDMVDPQGEPVHHLMNMIGYDYVALGNHEFDYQLEGIKRGVESMDITALCANANFDETILEHSIKPYDILQIGGVRTAILGLIQLGSNSLPSAMPDNMRGVEFVDGVERSLDFEFLRDSADLIIALTHLGFEDDSLLVSRNSMFDLVVGGHTHTYLSEGRMINGTLVTQTGSKLRGVGITKIEMSGGEVISIDNSVLSLDGIQPDAEAMAYVRSCVDDSPLGQPIGEVDRTLSRVGLINLITDVVRERSGADIAFQNWGAIRIDSIAKGDIRMAQIYELEPFHNHIVRQELTLSQIKELILNKYNSSGKESRSVDLSTSGMKYIICVGDDGVATGVECFDMDGVEMDDRSYLVAMNNYINAAYIYSGQGKATAIENRVIIADAVIEFIKSRGLYRGDNERRVEIKDN